MARLYLVGTAHFDIDSSQRLERLLAALQPAIVGVETTKKDFARELAASQHSDVIGGAMKNWKTHFPYSNAATVELLVQNIINEVQLLGRYFQSGKLLFCDNPSIVESPKFEQAIMHELKGSPELERLVSMPPEELRKEVAREYTQESYPVSDNPDLARFCSMRDRFAFGVLRRQLRLSARGQIVSISGLDHLYGDYHPNLFDRLAGLKPERMKLSDADKLP